MNWCMFGACAGCIPILLGFQENYRRLNLDKDKNPSKEPKKRREDKNLKRPSSSFGSIISFKHHNVDELVKKLENTRESSI